MKWLLISGAACLLLGGLLTFGPPASSWGLMLMLASLPQIFLGLFLHLLRDGEPD